MKRLLFSALLTLASVASGAPFPFSPQWQVNTGSSGPGAGKRVVLISGDEEYRSEEALPQLAKILSKRHGFETVVLFAQDPAAPGIRNPDYLKNIPGLKALADADLMIIATRFRDLPDDQMQAIDAYLKSGRPVIGLRTATHAFNIPADSKWAHYSFNYKGDQTAWQGGFGELVLGTSWIAHHGWHKKESSRGIITDAHPITTGIESGSIWSSTDVYTVKTLPADATPVAWGQVLAGMNPDDEPVGAGPYEYTPGFAKGNAAFAKNDPMQPLAWTKSYQLPGGKKGKVFASTLGASVDFANASTRRLIVQGAYWALGLPIPAEGVDAGLIGSYRPTMFGFTKDPTLWPSRNQPVAEPVPTAFTAPIEGEHIALVGNGLGERMLYFPEFETELQYRFPQANLVVRNLSYPGDTPGFRPRPSRFDQWAFPGAEKFHPDLLTHYGQGHYPTPDQWLTEVRADTLLALFGFNESFGGPSRLADFEGELDAFVQHTLAQTYNGQTAPRLVLVSPIAFEDLSATQDLPDGVTENKNLAAYTAAMQRVAQLHGIEFIDTFNPSRQRYVTTATPQTINGISLTAEGYRWFGPLLADSLYGKGAPIADRKAIYAAVDDKNWFWRNDYGMINGVHVHGRRYKPFGNENYPEEIEKIQQMIALRDQAIHRIAQGEVERIKIDDASTRPLTPVETNFDRPIEFLSVDQALKHFDMPEGYHIDLFASESEFPDLRNPMQMSWDSKGRLWVAVAPTYPHYKPGDPKPNDKILIFEDLDGDGRADRQKVFADGLHIPIGFEIAPEGVYLAQQPNLVRLVDTDGDDRADRTDILLHGFDTHDTHHSISAFCADPSGAIYMNEGRFLHSQVETPYGPQRCTDGGVWRFDPKSWRLERFMQTDVSNPWGVTVDEWGQTFLSDASGGANWWSLPLSAKIPHGKEVGQVAQFTTHRVRPTSGTEFVSSRHFPDEVQGDFLINNTIGFLGTKQHTMEDDGAGFTGHHRQDLVISDDPNFRPCDLEFAPDGSLYIIDWHNPLIGHMQHSARDPNRDHDHGRIYRVTYPSRPLVKPAQIAGASVAELLEVLKTPEQRTRYRARRELRGHPATEVLPAVKAWANNLDKSDPDYDRNLLEALWTTWGQNQVDEVLLKRVLASDRRELRAAALNVLRYSYRKIPDAKALFLQGARDPDERVRLTALVASSWMDNAAGAEIAITALESPYDHWSGYAAEAVMWTLDDDVRTLLDSGTLDPKATATARRILDPKTNLAKISKDFSKTATIPISNMSAAVRTAFERGRDIFQKESYCGTCHGEDGKGAIVGVYPPLVESEWIEDEELLVKIILKGLWGKIEVKGKIYDPANGIPPMTPFEGMMSDQEIANVATYTRVAFRGSKVLAELTTEETVAKIRAAVADKQGFYTPEELLQDHPRPKTYAAP